MPGDRHALDVARPLDSSARHADAVLPTSVPSALGESRTDWIGTALEQPG